MADLIDRIMAALRGGQPERQKAASRREKVRAFARLMGISEEQAEKQFSESAKEAQPPAGVRYKGTGRGGTFQVRGAPEVVPLEEPEDGLAGNMTPAELLSRLKQYTRPPGQRRKQAAAAAPTTPVDKALSAIAAGQAGQAAAAPREIDYRELAAEIAAPAGRARLPGIAGHHKALSVDDVAGDAAANQAWAQMHRQLGGDWLGPKSPRR